MKIEVSGQTHVGMKRNHNEDNLLLLPEERLFVVADGMGGHSSGEIASKIAVEEVAEFFRMTSQDLEITWPYKMDKQKNYDENRLATGVKLANMRIFEKAAAEQKYKGMGTTIVTIYFAKDSEVVVAHVGDSRVYFFRDNTLRQITEDHSLLNDYLKAKKLTPEEIEAFPHKNVIVRALGMKDTVNVDINRVEPKDGDIYLLCSDGLSGMVPDKQIEQILQSQTNLDKACAQLIDAANANGGNDNVTCVLAQYRRG
jgi:protein phosphatase